MRHNLFATTSAARRIWPSAILSVVVLILSASAAKAIEPVGQSRVLSFGWNDGAATGLGFSDSTNTTVATPILTTNLAGLEIADVAAGAYSSLVRTTDGVVYSFGTNQFGATGQGLNAGVSAAAAPINTSNLAGKKIVQMTSGGTHSLLLTEDGTVFSFGLNSRARTGLGTAVGETLIATPIITTNLQGKKIVQMSNGENHSLLLAEDGSVFSFGNNDYGRTGQGTNLGFTSLATPVNLASLSGKRVKQVAAGYQHSLLLTEDGTVFSFGYNHDGRTGLGAIPDFTLVPTPIITTNLGGKAIQQISAGMVHSLLLATDGTVFSFGQNGVGATGLSTLAGSAFVATPIDTTNLGGRTIVQVEAGADHSLLLASDGTAFSFGMNEHGQTGLGVTIPISTSVATPINISYLGGYRVTRLAGGERHSLVLAVAIPEPGTAMLVALFGIVLSNHRSSRRRKNT